MRIVSLLPSTTEILFAIGAGDDVVGVTFECDHPAEAQTRAIVSLSTMSEGLTPAQIDAEVKSKLAAGEDLYRLDEGALAGIDPDVVVTQDLCAVCAVATDDVDDALAHLGCRAQVVTIDPMSLDEVLASVLTLGEVTGHATEAVSIVADARSRLADVVAAVAGRPRPRTAIVEWTDPLFCAGHWVPDLVVAAGGESVLGVPGERSFGIEPSALSDARPEVVVVAPCGYRLAGAVKLATEMEAAGLVPDHAELWAVDADHLFVRPGPRLVDGVETLAGILHPDVIAPRPDSATRIER